MKIVLPYTSDTKEVFFQSSWRMKIFFNVLSHSIQFSNFGLGYLMYYIVCECYIFWLFISPSKSVSICPTFFYFQARCCYTPFISERKRTKNTVAKVHFKQVGKVNFFVVIHLIGSLTTNVRRRGGVVKNSSKSNVSTYLDSSLLTSHY